MDTLVIAEGFHDTLDLDEIERCWGGLPDGVSPADLEKIGAPGHVWIHADGRHYDADVPDGVERVLDLPFFRRHLDAARSAAPSL